MSEQELIDLIKKIDAVLSDADPDEPSVNADALETYDYIVAISAARKLIQEANL